jgi:hypothetical protein
VPPPDDSALEPTPEEFEEFVAAALRVNPAGLSGKHRRDSDGAPQTTDSEDRDSTGDH